MFSDLRRECARRRKIVALALQNRELIAAETRDDVVLADRTA